MFFKPSCDSLLQEQKETNDRTRGGGRGGWDLCPLQLRLGPCGPGDVPGGARLTVDHLGRHPVGVAHHRVPLFPVWLLEAPQILRLRLLVHHEPRQPEVGHHHVLVLG